MNTNNNTFHNTTNTLTPPPISNPNRDWHNCFAYLQGNATGYLSMNITSKQDTTPHYQFVSSMGNVQKQWPADTSLEDVLAELKNNGWEASVDNRDIAKGTLVYYHLDTMRTLQGMLLDKPRDYVDEICEHMPAYSGEVSQAPEIDGAEFGYIRFDAVPERGFSLNRFKGLPEVGVSCFEAEVTANGDYKFIRLTDNLVDAISSFAGNSELPVYRLYGEQVGHGSVGEPVIKVTRVERLTGKCLGPNEILTV